MLSQHGAQFFVEVDLASVKEPQHFRCSLSCLPKYLFAFPFIGGDNVTMEGMNRTPSVDQFVIQFGDDARPFLV